jgi:autotransporter passenger strand-loop-strand repeat protein
LLDELGQIDLFIHDSLSAWAACLDILSGGSATSVTDAGTVTVEAGATLGHVTVSSGGVLNVALGGTVASVTMLAGGAEIVSSGGVASAVTISGGTVEVQSGRSASAVTFPRQHRHPGARRLLELHRHGGRHDGKRCNRFSSRFRYRPSPTLLNVTSTGATLHVTDGMHAANIALLGNYMASTFTAAADGHSATTVVDLPVSQSHSRSSMHETISPRVSAMSKAGGGRPATVAQRSRSSWP